MPDDPATLRTALDALRADLGKLTLQHQQLRLEHVKLCCTLGGGIVFYDTDGHIITSLP